MKTLRYTARIDAPKETVWDAMLGDATYRDWTSAFAAGSYYEGDWSEGSRILFLAPDDEGRGPSGMVSVVVESRRPDRVSVQHIGVFEDGVEDTQSEKVKAWGDAFETYVLRAVDGGTEVAVEMDTEAEFEAMFDEKWPEALDRLKALAEEAHRAAANGRTP